MRELTPDIIKKLTDEQIELLVELGDLAKKEADLTEKIEEIRKLEEKVGLGRESRQNRALHEDKEYDDLLSIKSVREREMVRDKISELLNNLVKIGLGDLGLVQRQAVNYGVNLKR